MNRTKLAVTQKRIQLSAAAAALTLSFLPNTSLAQEPRRDSVQWGVPIGARVRVSMSGLASGSDPIVGSVLSADAHSLSLITTSGSRVVIPAPDVRRIELSDGRRRGVARGALIGTGVGLILGAVTPLDQCHDGRSTVGQGFSFCTRSETVGVVTLSGALWGAGIGYFKKSDHWREIPVTSLGRASDAARALPPVPPSAPSAIPLDPRPPLASSVRMAPGLVIGARLRVQHESRETKGVLVSANAEHIAVSGDQGVVLIPKNAVARLDVSSGRRRQLLKGLLIGAVAGVALDFADAPYCSSGGVIDTTCSRAQSAAETGLGGLIVGGAIGAIVRKDRWSPVQLEFLSALKSASSVAAETEVPPTLAWHVTPAFARGRGAAVRFDVSW